jgi:hypothetical protein
MQRTSLPALLCCCRLHSATVKPTSRTQQCFGIWSIWFGFCCFPSFTSYDDTAGFIYRIVHVHCIEPWFHPFVAIGHLGALAGGSQHYDTRACLAKGTHYSGAISGVGGSTCVAARFWICAGDVVYADAGTVPCPAWFLIV